MQSDTNTQSDFGMTQQQYDQLLTMAIKECRRERLFPRDHRIFLAGLIVGLTVMKLVVLYV